MLTVSAAAVRVGVCTKAIRRWDNRGLLRRFRTRGGHRRVPLSEVERVISERESTADSHMTCSRGTIVYARVPSHGQKTSGDLDRQVGELLTSSGEASPLVLTDIGSRLNMKRRGLWQLIYAAERGLVNRVIVTHRDILARFATKLIEHILCLHGVAVDVLLENRDRLLRRRWSPT